MSMAVCHAALLMAASSLFMGFGRVRLPEFAAYQSHSRPTGDVMKKSSAGRTLAAGSIGNFGEIYDFAVFGFSVPMLSLHFFPGTDRTAALLSTFAVYAVAFFARPLGGLLF